MFDRTNPEEYVKGIQQFTGTVKSQTRVRLLFCCYQSSDILVEALKLSPTKVHLGIFDECHRMGNNSAIYNKDGFVIEKRVFMTATWRVRRVRWALRLQLVHERRHRNEINLRLHSDHHSN